MLLVVNTASKCGFTPQYKGRGALSQVQGSGPRGTEFPCSQFGAQEPGNEEEIATFCETNYDVTFPMFSKVDVNGDTTAPVYRYLKSAKPGLLGTEKIKWDFTKFWSTAMATSSAVCAERPPESIERDVAKALQ